MKSWLGSAGQAAPLSVLPGRGAGDGWGGEGHVALPESRDGRSPHHGAQGRGPAQAGSPGRVLAGGGPPRTPLPGGPGPPGSLRDWAAHEPSGKGAS